MNKQTKAIIILSVLLVGGAGFASWKIIELSNELNATRFAKGIAWLNKAEQTHDTERIFPDCLFYAAKAIGFAGQGVDPGSDEEIPFLKAGDDKSHYEKANTFLASWQKFRPIWAGELNGAANDLSVSSRGDVLIAGGEQSSAQWLLTKDGTKTEFPAARSVAIHPLGKKIAIAGEAGLTVFEDGEEIQNQDGDLTATAWNLTGDQLAGARADGSVFLLDQKPTEIGKVDGKVSELTFGPKGATIAAVVPGKGVRLFFLDDFSRHTSWADHQADATAAAFHPDPYSEKIAIGHQSGKIEICRIFDGKVLSIIESNPVTGLGFREDGKRLASAHEDGLVRLWNTENETPELIAALNGHPDRVTSVVFFPDGETLASGGADGTVKIWDIREGTDLSINHLYNYIKDGWYTFDPLSQNVAWNAGSGFIGPHKESFAGTHKTVKELESQFSEAKKAGELSLASLIARKISLLNDSPPKNDSLVKEKKNFTNGEGSEMIWVKPGNFLMGELDGPDFAKQHKVTLSHGYWMGKHEITQKIYQSIMGENPSQNKKAGLEAPAENFNWFQASEFCRKLTAREKARGLLPAGWKYAIPTEAQWEYACRAGTTTIWSFGDDPKKLYQFANYNDKSGNFEPLPDQSADDGHRYTAPVGSFAANPWGFHDLHGNVFEWCRDAMDTSDPNYAEGAATDPFNDQGALRTIRGGGFDGTADECRSAYRDANVPVAPSENLGLRVVLVKDL